jgi:HPt (histidine-containing phosphotransfer) domain-containing protein
MGVPADKCSPGRKPDRCDSRSGRYADLAAMHTARTLAHTATVCHVRRFSLEFAVRSAFRQWQLPCSAAPERDPRRITDMNTQHTVTNGRRVTPLLPPPLDHNVLKGLRALSQDDGVDIVADLAIAFADDGRQSLRKMDEAVAVGNWTAARRAAHSLKSMSSSIGAFFLSELSDAFEKAEPGTMTRARLQLLEQEFERVTAALAAA